MRFLLAALLALSAALPAHGQAWEMLPLVPDRPGQDYTALDFLLGPTPAQDSLVAVRANGVFLYNPSGAAGAAGSNGEWGAWHPLCTNSLCAVSVGVVTEAGSIVVGERNRTIRRSTDRGRTWTANDVVYTPVALFESSLTALRGPAGAPALVALVSDDGTSARSLGDGAPGTWELTGAGLGYPQSLGEVPPSAALPNGRLLMGVWNGITTSDDGSLSWQRSNAYGSGRYIAWSFTFVRAESHPYGGVAFAGVQNVAEGGEYGGADVLRSDDGGRTWTRVHRFTRTEMDLPSPAGGDVSKVIVFATSDGALWAGVSLGGGLGSPERGGIMRSADGGATWVRADAGFRDASNRGYAVDQFVLARDGRLYAATTRGAWRTVAPAVASESGPEAGAPGVSVWPNPASGRVAVGLTLAEAGPVRVVVVDALGREVAVVLDGAAGAGETVTAVETGAWPAGVYVVRVTAGGRTASARLVVAR